MSHPQEIRLDCTTNGAIADALQRMATVLAERGASTFHVRAYSRAAHTVRTMGWRVVELLHVGGVEALEEVPTLSPRIARVVEWIAMTGRLPILEDETPTVN